MIPDLGFGNVIDELVEERTAWLNQLVAGQSMLNITVCSIGKKLLCVYKTHDKTSITVESTKGILGWLFRGETFVVSGSSIEAEEIRFNLGDIEITRG